jgi:hypothetical protein
MDYRLKIECKRMQSLLLRHYIGEKKARGLFDTSFYLTVLLGHGFLLRALELVSDVFIFRARERER